MKHSHSLRFTADSATVAKLDSIAPGECADCGGEVYFAWIGPTLRRFDAEPVDQPDLSMIVFGEHACPPT